MKWKFEPDSIHGSRAHLHVLHLIVHQHMGNEDLDLVEGKEPARASVLAIAKPEKGIIKTGTLLFFASRSRVSSRLGMTLRIADMALLVRIESV
jgi:hypothetical protein